MIGDLTYTYDAAGNRIKTGGSFARSTIPPALASVTYNANNQQATFGGVTETYDLNGNLATVTEAGVTTTYTWNARNQLTAISNPGFLATFSYDSFGRRTGKTIAGATTNFVYDGLNPVQEKNGSTVTANLLTGLGIDEFFMRTDGVGARALLTDALGSTIALGDGTGSLVTQYTYEPFGVTSETGAPSTNSYKYTGREDDGSGLLYYRARYYHPRLQRFISEDPIGFGEGINFYGYVSANPLSFRDPLGLDQRVCFYADAAFGFGHVGFGPPDSNTFGFYPDDPISGIGQVKLDEQKQQQCKLIKAPPDKDQCMLNCRLKRQGAPGPYVAYTRQCTSFVRECLKECGLPAGNSTGPFPRDFYNNLPGEGIK